MRCKIWHLFAEKFVKPAVHLMFKKVDITVAERVEGVFGYRLAVFCPIISIVHLFNIPFFWFPRYC